MIVMIENVKKVLFTTNVNIYLRFYIQKVLTFLVMNVVHSYILI